MPDLGDKPFPAACLGLYEFGILRSLKSINSDFKELKLKLDFNNDEPNIPEVNLLINDFHSLVHVLNEAIRFDDLNTLWKEENYKPESLISKLIFLEEWLSRRYGYMNQYENFLEVNMKKIISSRMSLSSDEFEEIFFEGFQEIKEDSKWNLIDPVPTPLLPPLLLSFLVRLFPLDLRQPGLTFSFFKPRFFHFCFLKLVIDRPSELPRSEHDY